MKKLLAILLVVAMCLALLAACASSTNTPAANDTPAAEDNNTPATENNDTPAAPADDEDEEVDPDEITEINFYVGDMMAASSNEAGIKAVTDAINEITEREIGVHVNFTYISIGEYGTQINLAISGGDQVDLCCVWIIPPANFATMYGSSQLMDISGYVDQYGQDLVATVGDYLNAYRVGDGLYGVPCYRNYASTNYIVMRKDILDELGMTELGTNMTTFTEYEQILEAVKQNYTDIYGLGGTLLIYQVASGIGYTGDNFQKDFERMDTMGDSLCLLGADITGDGKVVNTVESEGFIWSTKKIAEWDAAGYIWPDSSVTDMTGDEIFKQGVEMSMIAPAELGVEASKKAATGYDVVAVEAGAVPIATTLVLRFGLGVPVTAEEPEAAVKFMNLLYNSEELMNLIDYGIEGEDYIVENGVAKYPESGMRYHLQDFELGNFFLVLPWEGVAPDFRAVSLETLKAAPVSPFLGFVLDTSEMTDTVAALTSVMNEYNKPINTLGYSDELYNNYLSKLKAAGIDEYVAEAQAQLDAWLGR